MRYVRFELDGKIYSGYVEEEDADAPTQPDDYEYEKPLYFEYKNESGVYKDYVLACMQSRVPSTWQYFVALVDDGYLFNASDSITAVPVGSASVEVTGVFSNGQLHIKDSAHLEDIYSTQIEGILVYTIIDSAHVPCCFVHNPMHWTPGTSVDVMWGKEVLAVPEWAYGALE